MSVTLAVHNDEGHVIGVVGTDLTIDDLLTGATYLRLSDLSYMFIIDSTGKYYHFVNNRKEYIQDRSTQSQ